ncbi:MAG: hypothetical protein QGF59_09515 [Pirellulaceae bacterium]|jgi:hypothetical protein|nr:hypothetical protein [Pirellulaceae bacterium]
MSFDLESLRQQIPYYLTAEDQSALVEELKAIASGGTANYLLSAYDDSFLDVMLQGDGWRGFQLFLFDTGERRSVRGLVLSNSCDVDPDNPREVPARVVFAPLVKLATYKALLDASGISADRVVAKIEFIKAQMTTNIFYLPAGGPLKEDYVVRFDEAQSMPVAAHRLSPDRQKLFTLSSTGFYMLVLKLSVHFCRLQENVIRKPAEGAA